MGALLGGVEMWMFGTGVAAYGLFGVLVAEGCINIERTLARLGGVTGGCGASGEEAGGPGGGNARSKYAAVQSGAQ